MTAKFTRTLGVAALATVLATASSCTKDLDQIPTFSANSETVYSSPTTTFQALARLYATFALTGQNGANGPGNSSPDISGIDEGFSNYLRQYWQIQQVTTDEAVIGWADGTLPLLNTNQWDANNEFVRATYDRIYFAIALCNDFIRQTSDDNLSRRGLGGNDANLIRTYRAEARVLRALSYWHAVDLFGNGPFVTETDPVGVPPRYGDRATLFNYVESELKAVDASNLLLDPRASYGRADKAVCWTLLTKLYLNARVYTGTDRSTDAITFANRVLGAGYQLNQSSTASANAYQMLFLADNDKTNARNEVIFPITFDGLRTQNFGGMTYLVHAPVGRAVTPASAGINGGWFGLRTKPNLVNLFSTNDRRRDLLFFQGQNPRVDTLSAFSSGVLVRKFRNVTSTGVVGSDPSGNFPDTDFPMFRLADVQLMYAEAILRGGQGATQGTALAAVNAVRSRAGAAPLAAVTLEDILAERGRELFWEGHRRTDLIRFGRYTTGNNWPFKGGLPGGRDIEPFRVLFPIPNTDLTVNSNLRQNPGY